MLWPVVLLGAPLLLQPAVACAGASSETTPGAETNAVASPRNELITFLVAAGEDALAHERFAEAQGRFAAALQLDWNQPRAFALLQKTRAARSTALRRWEAEGRAARAHRDFAAARLVFERVLAEDSSRSDLRDLLSSLTRQERASELVRTGLEKFIVEDFAGAQLDFEQALAVDPADTLAANCRNRAMQNAVHGASLTELKSDPETWSKYLEALQRFRAGDLHEAERLWNEILTKYPGNAYVRSNLEQVRRRVGAERVAATE